MYCGERVSLGGIYGEFCSVQCGGRIPRGSLHGFGTGLVLAVYTAEGVALDGFCRGLALSRKLQCVLRRACPLLAFCRS